MKVTSGKYSQHCTGYVNGHHHDKKKNPFRTTGKVVVTISLPQMRRLSPREDEQTAHK